MQRERKIKSKVDISKNWHGIDGPFWGNIIHIIEERSVRLINVFALCAKHKSRYTNAPIKYIWKAQNHFSPLSYLNQTLITFGFHLDELKIIYSAFTIYCLWRNSLAPGE